MLVGFDLDNTIFHYDSIWSDYADKYTVVSDNPKEALKEILSEKDWIELQSVIYGECLKSIKVNPLWFRVFEWLDRNHIKFEFVSHKTEFCYSEKKAKLREASDIALRLNGLDHVDVNYFSTAQEKIDYINSRFDIFFDDLVKIIKGLSISFPVVFRTRANEDFIIVNDPNAVLCFLQYLCSDGELTKNSRSTYFSNNYFYKKLTNRDRLQRETDALRCHQITFENEYCVIKVKKIDGLSPLSYLDGRIAEKIVDELRRINKFDVTYFAKDSCMIEGSWALLRERLLVNTSKYKDQLLELHDSYKFNYFCNYKGLYFSPDLNPMNIGVFKDDILIFDFESAGLDDPFRVLINFLLHPQNKLSTEENFIFIEKFKVAYLSYLNLNTIASLFTYCSLLWLDIISSKGFDLEEYFKKIGNKEELISWRMDYYERIIS